jgi:hypothetical protein
LLKATFNKIHSDLELDIDAESKEIDTKFEMRIGWTQSWKRIEPIWQVANTA